MFNVKQGYPIKIFPKIAPRGSECEKTCRVSWPGNLFQVLSLTFDLCLIYSLRLNGVVTLKHPYFSLIIGAMVSECKDRP